MAQVHSPSPTRTDSPIPLAYRFFPGWTMLTIASMAQFMSAPGQSYSVAAFKDPMRKGLEISETSYAFAYGFATILSGISLPFLGQVLDRWGARRALPLVALVLGFGCLWMSQTSTLLGLYVGFGVVRSLGQGALSLIAGWIVGEWFKNRRGFATALAGMGGSLSVMLIPPLNGLVIAQFGWETGWIVLAVCVWVLLVVPAVVLLRDRPEDLGLLPDGEIPSPPPPAEDGEKQANPPVVIEPALTVREVLRDPSFWKLLAVPATSGMVGTGLVFHQVALLSSRGVTAEWALGLISVQAAIATLTSLLAGWLTDRIPSRYLLMAAMAFLATGVTTILTLPTVLMAMVYAFVLGLHGSIMRSTGQVVWLTYYGRTYQGSIRGLAFSVMVFAAAVGPLPMALSIDYFGSYHPALWTFLLLPSAAGLIVWTAHPPRTVTVAKA